MIVIFLLLSCIGKSFSYPIVDNYYNDINNIYYNNSNFDDDYDDSEYIDIIELFNDFIDGIINFYLNNLNYIDYLDNELNITNIYPTVLLHGVLASKNNLEELQKMLENDFNITVFNLEIGNGVITSLYTPMDKQLQILCDTIYGIDELKNGFNFIGMSQGGLLARGYVEYCNAYPVKNLITLVSPNGGVYYNDNLAENYYEPNKQDELSFTNYWRDPYRYDLYLKNSTYLAQLNNEIPLKNGQNNLDVVDNFVMIWSAVDDVVKPPQSGKFSLYDIIDNKLVITDLFLSELYSNDFLKLKTMNEQGRLHIHETDCLHSEHKSISCYEQLYDVFKMFLI